MIPAALRFVVASDWGSDRNVIHIERKVFDDLELDSIRVCGPRSMHVEC